MAFNLPRPRTQERPAPMPMPDRQFDFRRNMPLPVPMPSPRDMGLGSLMPSNIGVDRGPTTMDPLQTMLNNPQVMRDALYAKKLEEQMDPNNFLTNRIAVGEQFGVDPFGDMPMQAPYREEAALDPSDYRTIIKILEAGGNPEDYMAANRGGIASLLR